MAVAHMWSEFVGMTLFVFLGAGSAINGGSILQVALTFGFAIFVLAVAIGHHSGGQMNCAVTLALVITKDLSPLQGLLNFIAQIFGSITGAFFLWAVFPSDMDQTKSLGSNMLSPGYNWWNAFVGEIIMTFLLVFVVFESAVNPAYKGTLAQLAIGMAVFLAHSIMIAVDGCSINPTRSFGPAVVASMRDYGKTSDEIWQHHWIFWVGPLLGATLAALMVKLWWKTSSPLPSDEDQDTCGVVSCGAINNNDNGLDWQHQTAGVGDQGVIETMRKRAAMLGIETEQRMCA